METNIKKIPYGVSDYGKMAVGNHYYVDKTDYLRIIEDAGYYLFFIRPRRFGKSLFLSMMEGYYDVCHKDRFEELFKGTTIFDNPTPERGTYLVLSFNFSMVDPAPDNVEESFLEHVRGKAGSFILKYRNVLLPNKEEYVQSIKESRSAADILSTLIRLCKDSGQKIYTVIDEYDNFSNTILAVSGEGAYQDLTRGEGFFRSFFNILKGGTGGMDAPIKRLFLTGVSPITLDDVTSGYNIGQNISTAPRFNQMLGFTETDVQDMLDYYREHGLIAHDNRYLLPIIRRWYNNYIFSPDADTPLFNPDMVLYFLYEYFKRSGIPENLIDRNVRIDYGKLRHLIVLDSEKGKATNGNFSRLKQIVEDGYIRTEKLVDGFPVEKMADTENFVSLLFYFGLLTIKEVVDDEPVLQIPNETARRLYYDYIKEAYQETDIFSMDWYRYGRLMHSMAYKGDWKPLLEYLGQRMKESMGLRDLMTGEKSIQAFLNVYLGLSQLYIIHPERELNKGFADIVMEPFTARYPGMKHAYIIEIKYIKKNDKNQKIEPLVKQAKEQLKRYTQDSKFKKNFKGINFINLIVVFCGTELKYIGEAK